MRDIIVDVLLLLANSYDIAISYYVHPDAKDLKTVERIYAINDNTLWLLRCQKGLDDRSFTVNDINHISLDANRVILVFEEDMI